MNTTINCLTRTLVLTLSIASAPALARGPSHTGALATKATASSAHGRRLAT